MILLQNTVICKILYIYIHNIFKISYALYYFSPSLIILHL